jgi:hypothetical protein
MPPAVRRWRGWEVIPAASKVRRFRPMAARGYGERRQNGEESSGLSRLESIARLLASK